MKKIFVILVFLLSCSNEENEIKYMVPSYNWKQIAGSSVIVSGILKINDLCEIKTPNDKFVDIELADLNIIAPSNINRDLRIRYWTAFSSFDNICKYNGKKIIVFLMDNGDGNFNLIESDSVRLKEFVESDVKKINNEILRQDSILRIDLKQMYNGKVERNVVKGMYDSLFIDSNHYQLYRRIFRHSKDLSPYFVLLMNSDRELITREIEYPIDNPNWFESVAHYRVETSIDLFSTALESVNKIEFNSLTYNPTPQKRAHNVRAWKVWAYENYFNQKPLPNKR